MSKTYKKRDQNIQKATKKELDLSTRIVKSKTVYTRKEKYKSSDY